MDRLGRTSLSTTERVLNEKSAAFASLALFFLADLKFDRVVEIR